MKHICFLSGTRADYGKLKSLIEICEQAGNFRTSIFATGMHMDSLHGNTIDEIHKSKHGNIFPFVNYETINDAPITLARTVSGFTSFVREYQVDLIVVHGDRVEALAGAIVGSLSNILVAHIEGGEISGTVDEHIRHAVTKLSHIHLVSNNDAVRRLIQLGERKETVHVIGSPDIDVMLGDNLPSLAEVKDHYEITFDDFAIVLFHPVTTEAEFFPLYAKNFVAALQKSKKKYIVIYPNNDLGSDLILKEYKKLEKNALFRIFPSIGFERFLKLLQNAQFIIGNSSAGVREAPYYSVPTIDIGTRQQNRSASRSISHCGYEEESILHAISKLEKKSIKSFSPEESFGSGNSASHFLELLNSNFFWDTSLQKTFVEQGRR